MLSCILYYLIFQLLGIILLICVLFTGKTHKYHFSKYMQKIFNVKFRKKINSESITQKKRVFYFCNHNSWADFFIDHCLTGGTYLARYLALFAMGLLTLYMWLVHGEEGFKRQKGASKNIKKLIKNVFKKTKNKNMIIYPEGTRNRTNKIQELKWGLIKIAFEEKILCQIIITSDKNRVFNEKQKTVERGVICDFFASKLIDPNKYSTLESFYEKITTEWKISWEKAFNKDQPSINYKLDKERFKMHCRLESNLRINIFRLIIVLILFYMFKGWLLW
jgi:1-acyl-sn-glycerol-3-phosphate acyltransferase